MVTVIPEPFTRQAKQAAIQKDVRQHYETYFDMAARTRAWFPDRLPQRKEMAGYGHLVSDESRELLLGFLGVESFVDDYVFAGINAAGNTVTTRQIYSQWGFEERRHGQTFQHALIDSGLYTQEFVDHYLAEISENQWTFERQTGYEGTPLLASAYAIFQERQTRWVYTALRMRLWREYGSPTDQAGRRALRRAVENFQNLPEGGVVQLPDRPIRDLPESVASAIYEMRPTGDFVLVGQDEGAGI